MIRMTTQRIFRESLFWVVLAAIALLLLLWKVFSLSWLLALGISTVLATTAALAAELIEKWFKNPEERLKTGLKLIIFVLLSVVVAILSMIAQNEQIEELGKAFHPFQAQILTDQLKAFDLGVQIPVIQFSLDTTDPGGKTYTEQELIDLARALGLDLPTFEEVLQQVKNEYNSEQFGLSIYRSPWPEAYARFKDELSAERVAKKLEGLKSQPVVELYWVGYWAMTTAREESDTNVSVLKDHAKRADIPLEVITRFEGILHTASSEAALKDLREAIEAILRERYRR